MYVCAWRCPQRHVRYLLDDVSSLVVAIVLDGAGVIVVPVGTCVVVELVGTDVVG